MGSTLFHVFLVLAHVLGTTASGKTEIYIDSLSAYSSLSGCALREVRDVVKNMSYACGGT